MLETKKSFIYVFFNSYFNEYKRRRVYTDRGGGITPRGSGKEIK